VGSGLVADSPFWRRCLQLALILPALGTLVLGIFPGWLLDLAGRSSTLAR